MNFQEFKYEYEKAPVKEYSNRVGSAPLVSISVVSYQQKNYIKDCLDGILMQKTDFPFEILLGEDGSTDGTREICIEYAEAHPEIIRLFLHDRVNNIIINGSPTGRFNFLYNLYSLRGKYIALCDGDDYWTDPYKLQKQVDILESNADCVLTYHDWVESDNGEKREPKVIFPATHTLVFRNIIKIDHILVGGVLNGDTAFKFLLNQHGKFKFIPGIEPAVKRRDSKGIWNSLSPYRQIQNKLITNQSMINAYNDQYDISVLKQRHIRYFYELLCYKESYKGKNLSIVFSTFKIIYKYKLFLNLFKYCLRQIFSTCRSLFK